MDLLSFCTDAYPCLSKLSVSLKLRRVCVYLGVMLLHRHRAAFGGSLVKFQGVGVVVKFDVLTLLCSSQTLFFGGREDDRKCVCASQATFSVVLETFIIS